MNNLITFQRALSPELPAYLQSMSQDPQSRPRASSTRNVQLRSVFVGQVSNLPEDRGDSYMEAEVRVSLPSAGQT